MREAEQYGLPDFDHRMDLEPRRLNFSLIFRKYRTSQKGLAINLSIRVHTSCLLLHSSSTGVRLTGACGVVDPSCRPSRLVVSGCTTILSTRQCHHHLGNNNHPWPSIARQDFGQGTGESESESYYAQRKWGQQTTKVFMGLRPNDEKGGSTSTTPVVHHRE